MSDLGLRADYGRLILLLVGISASRPPSWPLSSRRDQPEHLVLNRDARTRFAARARSRLHNLTDT
jgi:hypothetical protein